MIRTTESERIPLQSLYRLAPALFALKHGIQDEGLIQQMLDEADAQVTEDASYDKRSLVQYRFHYVSSYLFCYVINEELEELEYNRFFEFVNERMDLFNDDYGIE